MAEPLEDGALAELIEDLEAHLRWRLAAGITRLPPPRPYVAAEPSGAWGGPRAEAAAPTEAFAPSANTASPSGAGSGPRGGERGTGSSALLELRTELGDCTRCKLSGGRTNLVFGVGNPATELVFVGEGPGAEEDRRGEPFVGRAGELLTRMIAAMGYARAEVYICNVVKCRPPNNRDPEPDEVAACRPFLDGQLAAIAPRVIVGLGKFAAQFLIGDSKARITRVRGRWFTYRGIPVMPTYHPAYLLRNPAAKRDAWNDLQAVMKRLGKSVERA